MNNYMLIFFGGGIGCAMRYWVSSNMYNIMGHRFPYGTLIVNTTGSFLMGLLFIVILERCNSFAPQLRSLLLIGFMGGYTTFSSFSIETLVLIEQGAVFKAFLNITLNFILCMLAVWLGVALGRQI